MRHETAITRLFLFAMGVYYSLPLLLRKGIPHFPFEDTVFHLSRIVGFGNIWKYPVSFLNFHHNGLMVNLCYPWLTAYPVWLLYKLCGSFINAYKLFYLLLTVLTLFLAHDIMHRISGNRLSALAFALLYTFSAYRFENLFHRSALGEVIAITLWLPVFYGLYQIFFGDVKQWGWLTAGMALLAYSHNLSLLIASLATGLTFLITVWFWDEKRKRIRTLVVAGLSAVMMSLGSLLPMFQLFSSETLQIPGGTGLSLKRSSSDLPVMVMKMLRNENSMQSVGLLIFIALLCLCVFTVVRLLKPGRFSGNKAIDLFFLTGFLVLLMVSDLPPWEWIGDHTFMRQIQFVGRLNTCPTLFIAAAFAWYLPQMIPHRKYAFLIPLVLCIGVLGSHYQMSRGLYRLDHSRIYEDYVVSGYAGSMDYAPLRAKQYRDETHLPNLEDILDPDGGVITAEVTYPEKGAVYHAVLTVLPSEAETVLIDLPVFWYSTQRCSVNGEEIPTALSNRGGTSVPVRSGAVSEIQISYRYTALARAAWAFSFLAAVLFVVKNRLFRQ